MKRGLENNTTLKLAIDNNHMTNFLFTERYKRCTDDWCVKSPTGSSEQS